MWPHVAARGLTHGRLCPAVCDRVRTVQTHYEVLGVTMDADQAAIRRAYLGLCKKTHPDMHGLAGAQDPTLHEAFLRVQDAYRVLRDPTLRAFYDGELRGGRAPPSRRGEDRFDHLHVPLMVAVLGGSVVYEGHSLSIDSGTLTGDRLRVRGLGGPGRPRGDLVLEVLLLGDDRWRLDGIDLHVELPITWLEAYRGGSLTVRTPWRTVALALAPGEAQAGVVWQFVGDGLRRDDSRGNLYAHVVLVAPPPGDAALLGVLLRLQGQAQPRAALAEALDAA